jgi:hypothetical protein
MIVACQPTPSQCRSTTSQQQDSSVELDHPLFCMWSTRLVASNCTQQFPPSPKLVRVAGPAWSSGHLFPVCPTTVLLLHIHNHHQVCQSGGLAGAPGSTAAASRAGLPVLPHRRAVAAEPAGPPRSAASRCTCPGAGPRHRHPWHPADWR